MDFPRARQRFYQEVTQPEEHINLAAAALYIAQEEYPALEPEVYLNALDGIASEVKKRLPSEQYPLRILQTINRYLYEDLGFTGNTADYYDPKNSFLNDVLDRRTGIPITLSLVYLEIARHIGLPMVGVGMPGHFLIRPNLEDMEIYVDPFHQGEILFVEDCQERLTQIYDRPIEMTPDLLPQISSRRFLARMLTNLKMIYLQHHQLEKALAVIERILLLFPEAPLEHRDRGILYYHLNRWLEARHDLETYLTMVPTAEDTRVIEQLLTRMQQFL
ncbi:MAG: transglutaminase-like domain-containing protein [Leptolyngbyaceae bacterium]|nr:transglutaminase-like domain-containing protein [Leptolyngbyaceae bacterium]